MSVRPEADRCPGLLRTFSADDGAIVRLRVAGGRLTTDALCTLMAAAEEHAAPFVQLTSRANLQVRGLADPVPAGFVDAATRAGFLPHPTHERVRNLVASPWSGRAGEVAALVADLDDAICAEPDLARLPGRVLMVVDDGSGDILGLPYDLGYRMDGADGLLLVAGGRARPVPRSRVVGEFIALAQLFVAARESREPAPWNVAELPADDALFTEFTMAAPAATPAPAAGAVGPDLVVTVPLGLLTAGHARALGRVSDVVVVTPWRRLVVPAAAGSAAIERDLARAGLVVQPETGWDDLTACIGAPSCRRTTVPTLDLARGLAAHVHTRTHLSGCARRCGHPSGPYLDLVAPAGLDEALTNLRGSAGD